MIKLVAIDLDDTLLTKEKEITSINKEAIENASKMGVKIVIASGRPYFRVKPILEQLNLCDNENYVITYNGANISKADYSKVYQKNVLTKEDKDYIIDVIKKYQLHYLVYYDDLVYTTSILDEIKDKPVFYNLKFTFSTEEEILSLPYTNKIIISDNDEVISKYRNDIEKALSEKYNLLLSTPNFFEILTKNSNKGLALKELCKILGIKKEETMAIGDEENDYPMFEYAAYSIAMRNANPLLKQHAIYITDDQENSGVGKAIYKYIN